MAWLACPYLGGEVEWTEERERHIAGHHPDLLPRHRDKIPEILADPDQVRPSTRLANAKMFSRWYADVQEGKYVVVVVVTDDVEAARHWIVTAYITRRLARGEVEWTRD